MEICIDEVKKAVERLSNPMDNNSRHQENLDIGILLVLAESWLAGEWVSREELGRRCEGIEDIIISETRYRKVEGGKE